MNILHTFLHQIESLFNPVAETSEVNARFWEFLSLDRYHIAVVEVLPEDWMVSEGEVFAVGQKWLVRQPRLLILNVFADFPI
jgi:hypothetical protein